MADREFDIIVYGATGFTGRLVAEYLAGHYGDGSVRWAMAGRSLTKLEEVRDAIGAPADTPLLTANADDPAALKAMVSRAQVVITTVGPYQLYGEPLLAACAEAGTAYVDLCGEPAWMRQMIDKYEATAKTSGARIVFSCGFDSIPFDLGVWTVQQEAKARFGKPAPRVKGRIRAMKGTFSGGTFASGKATMAAAAKDPSILKLMIDPFALAPGSDGPSQPNGMVPHYDEAVGGWVAPFMMAVINTKNVHRTNFLAGQPYGADFQYDEMMIAPGLGDIGKAAAEAIAKLNPMNSDKGPAPGEGPSKEERETGYYEIAFVAEMPDGARLTAVVKGDKDPGYGSTSKMIAESALCLLRDVQGEGGIWTAGALMPEPLRKRLEAHAGLSFAIE
ncbi:saccharopine dehydrogenase NADP-binding domain-containing protein [Sphingomonas psychrotolerans]|uniref:Saccharopine dehydrogenase NADP-binding domain-containing protein n=1 Tax=Sphingomonas psychrotolerans TaxID=1327635 RepID=A0ABU3N548_9SPHN|nr:saccharopine dehydrogenase NADP-binding domain-containing protein [Sphingomonas psychrotolerans]MDT8759658.1 saccharopine dehydrogenase NADP-binding domain-containing protein [Sphingomonas psychrotolerans]